MHAFRTAVSFYLLLLTTGCTGQADPNRQQSNASTPVGGGCDGCELMYVGMPAHIDATATSAGWREEGQKLIVSGTAYQVDARTPAAGVIIYYWHTDNNGYYAPVAGMDKRAERHGHIRGWMKTDANGRYVLCTIRPQPYPNASEPAHIHISVKEPDIANEYYTDELVFADDPFLTAEKRAKCERRGGSGILHTTLSGDVQTATHDFILGLNIPGYPQKQAR